METFASIVSLAIVGAILIGCAPTAIANARPLMMHRLVTSLVGLEFLVATALALGQFVAGGQPLAIQFVELFPKAGVNLGIFIDGTTSLMLLLVSFVGFVVSRFSFRYLEGEASQGRYFRWLGFTIGAVSLMVVAGNLVLFFTAWVMTSLGLHQLLLHYRHRPAAHRAAWTKFVISRLGDASLIAALMLIFQAFGTFDLPALFTKVAAAIAADQHAASHTAIAWLLMLGAAAKSAQFPFHIWLPDTMETPTPVSALMHAGVVNAGGYLVIRLSPLFALSPEALLTLGSIGAFTACFAGVVMMTQPSIKRALAYSTIAQMGFMMLQCGLGAFSAAMLHIVAHSLYKAHAFLASGNAVAQSRSLAGAAAPAMRGAIAAGALVGAAIATLTASFVTSFALGFDHFDKPGGVVLVFIFFLGLTSWGWQLFALRKLQSAFAAWLGIGGLCLAYTACFAIVDRSLRPTQPTIDFPSEANFVFAGIALAFVGLFALNIVFNRGLAPSWSAALRVHAANGFYLSAAYQRFCSSLAKS